MVPSLTKFFLVTIGLATIGLAAAGVFPPSRHNTPAAITPGRLDTTIEVKKEAPAATRETEPKKPPAMETAGLTDIKPPNLSQVKPEKPRPEKREITKVLAQPAQTPTSVLPTTGASGGISPTAPSFKEVNERARSALVNIICAPRIAHPLLKSISGSGVIIDSRGIILTNAHLGQYLLLRDYQTKDSIVCTARSGSPARNRHEIELLFISPSWIAANSRDFKEENPTGTGEFDFAILKIKRPEAGAEPPPDSFPYLRPDTTENTVKVGDELLLAGYPTEFLSAASIERDLFAASSVVKIAEIFTFEEQTADLIALSGNILAQKGSSGGGAVTAKGDLVGIFVTSTDGETTSNRTLRAITIPYISRALKRDWDKTLDEFLDADWETEATRFNEKIRPKLQELLYQKLTAD